MHTETFLGSEIIEIYKQINFRYPNGVNYISTKQLIDGNKIRYAISFKPIAEKNDIANAPKHKVIPTDESSQEFLETLNELEQELVRLEELVNENKTQETCIKKIKRELIKKGINKKWLEEILGKLNACDIKEDKNLILNFILDEIEATFTFANNVNKKPNILMMVGPTGVGKTTSVAKIALKFKDDIQNDRVAFVNLDHNRVAASEQLRSYASLFDIDYADLHEESEFTWQLSKFNDKEIVFVDTGGISPFDIKKLLDTVSFITEASQYDIKIALVLPATLKKEDLESMHENFSFLGLDYLILTKFDETASITELADFLIACDIPMYYFSVGQDIHNNLIAASSEYLREKLMKEWQKIEC